MSVRSPVSPSFVASLAWGTDALLALAVASPIVAALRSEWPALGAEALVAPGGLELGEFLRERGSTVGGATLAFVVLLVLRFVVALGLDAWHAQSLGSARPSSSLVLRMGASRLVGLAVCAVLLAAAGAPFYGVRDVPLARLSTAGNLVFAAVFALPSLLAAAVAAAVERVARGYVARDDGGFGSAWGAALRAPLGPASPAFRRALVAVLLGPVVAIAGAALARLPYGAGLVLGQVAVFVAAWLRASAHARAVLEGRGEA